MLQCYVLTCGRSVTAFSALPRSQRPEQGPRSPHPKDGPVQRFSHTCIMKNVGCHIRYRQNVRLGVRVVVAVQEPPVGHHQQLQIPMFAGYS
jgi:hypothetical protein